ncbi:MAG: divalent-cation tolerance protein CutA [Campylobacteraceae bacterium]|jgi:periplasmic divalent cation tolerance protein|nr:divalent-cation tolerance protein CutA [Campylobacteraceae bacterium]
MSYAVIFTTVSDTKTAQSIADALLSQNLAACVSVGGVFSTYKWQGKVERAEEIELKIKTKAKHYKKIEKLINSLSGYEVSEVLMFEVKKGSEEYLKWIDKSLKVKK